MRRRSAYADGVADLWRFPNPVNEIAARCVAAGVVLMAASALVLSTTLGSGWLWISVVIAYGFVARVATGPTLSPLGQLATRVLAPRLGPAKLVAGPPKRFAQVMGATMSVLAVVLYYGFGLDWAAQIVLGLIVVAATLESVFAICIGCAVFGWLMRRGVIPEETCAACANISLRYPTAA
jgi:Domain of unknown function (DUF4395)